MPYQNSLQYRKALQITPPSLEEINGVQRRLEAALQSIKNADNRKEISFAAGAFVAYAARAKAPRSRKVHYRYKNVRDGQRRANGTAINDRVAYLPGNLQLSIRTLSNLRRTIRAIIGPRVLAGRAKAKVYGRNERNVDAYYAQMVFGSALAFRDRVMIPALLEQEPRVRAYIAQEIDKLVRIGAQRQRLTG